MTNDTTRTRKTLTAMVGCLLVIGLASCGSSDKAADAPSGATGGGSDGSVESGGGGGGGGGGAAKDIKDGDPCQWYSAKEMSTLVGFDVKMTQQESPLGRECVYDSDANFLRLTVRPSDAATYDSDKAGMAAVDKTQVDYPGVGDAAYHDVSAERLQENNQPSVVMSAKKGDAAVDVELASAGSPALSTTKQGIEITSAVAKKVLGD